MYYFFFDYLHLVLLFNLFIYDNITKLILFKFFPEYFSFKIILKVANILEQLQKEIR